MDFGEGTFAFSTGGRWPALNIDLRQDIHAVKFGANHRFGGGPIVANF
jgi:hypothetical protein